MTRKRVAIVGSGCSGMAALWALKRTDHEVHLFEASDRLGGHTNTATFRHNGAETPVDTGFIVFNMSTYRPSFLSTMDAPEDCRLTLFQLTSSGFSSMKAFRPSGRICRLA